MSIPFLRVRRVPQDERLLKSFQYVGTAPREGIGQLKILVYEGCRPENLVLEVGCGTLMAGYPIIQFLNEGKYVGLDPNKWLINDALEINAIKNVIEEKKARFIFNDQFDAAELNEKFDYIISHSILSHAACWQLPQFIENLDKVLKPGGKILASIRFCEGNSFGSPGYHGTEDDFRTWQYPGVSFFRKKTVESLAKKFKYQFRIADEYLALMVSARRGAVQDWIVLTKQPTT